MRVAAVNGLRRLLAALLLAAVACWPTLAMAMPPVVAVVLIVGLEVAGIAIATTMIAGIALSTYIMVGTMVYGVIQARDAKRKARNAANAAIQDRNVTVMSAEAPWTIIYGEAVVGYRVAAILTSGDKDQYKHVVAVWADHECDSIQDVMIAGESIGTLDSNGYVTSGKWLKSQSDVLVETIVLSGAGEGTLAQAPAALVSVVFSEGEGDSVSHTSLDVGTVTLVGATFTVQPSDVAYWAGKTVTVNYSTSGANALLRVRHHLGTDTQAADASLLAECGADWSASDQLKGKTYSVFRFDLTEPEFQGGPPQATARIRGRKVYDSRTGTTAWSANNALCTADFLRAEFGKRCLSTQVNWASVSTAANDCDTAVPEQGGAPLFTCNGAFNTDADPDATLDALCQSMAGFATWTGEWHLQAGVYTAPVMALTDADNAGSVEVLAAPSSMELFNGVRGQFYDPARHDQLTDYPPYSNAAFVTEDGAALWSDLSLPYTNAAWRAHNLARIFVERSRGTQMGYPAKLKTLKLRVGQRVTLSNSMLGISESVFRVVKREYRLGQAVQLALAQDDPTMYDRADAPASLASPSVGLNDPFVVAAPAGLAATSGDGVSLTGGDGTAIVRMRVAWDASTDNLVTSNGAMQVDYRAQDSADWLRAPEAPGDSTSTYIDGLKVGVTYVGRARWRNGIGAVSDWRAFSVLAMPDTTAPENVAGLAYEIVAGGLRLSWTPCVAPDYDRTVLRYGATYAGSAQFWEGKSSDFTVRPPADGVYVVWAVHVDRTNNASATPASLTVTYTAMAEGVDGDSVIIEYSVDGSTSWHSTFTTGDLFTRWKVGTAGAWNGPWRIVGESGAAGDYKDFVFKRSASAPATPTGATPAGWFDSPPAADGNPLWVSYADKTAAGALIGVWSAPVQIEGAAGARTAVVYLYRRATSTPALPTTTTTYDFTTNTPSGMNNSWTAAIPAGSNPLYVTAATATAAAGATSDTIASGEWASPVILVQDGVDGNEGAKVASVRIYRRTTTSSTPALPSLSSTYTFADGSMSGLNNSWQATVPSSGGAYLWTSQATALSTGTSDSIAAAEWSAAVLMAQDGATGGTGTQGNSAARAYALFTGNPVVTGAAVTRSGTSLPLTTSWSPTSATSWTSTPQTVGTNQSMFQSDGVYDAIASQTVWGTPYLSNWKVGSLSAISADLGNITAGNINTSGYVNANGNSTLTLYDPGVGIGSSPGPRTVAIAGNYGGTSQIGVVGVNNQNGIAAIYGYNSHASGVGVQGYGADTGVAGYADSVGGRGVYGETVIDGAYGVYGYAEGLNSAAVYGFIGGLGCAGKFATSGTSGSANSIALQLDVGNSTNRALMCNGKAEFSGRITSTVTGTNPFAVVPRVSAKPTAIAGGIALHTTYGLIVSDGTSWYYSPLSVVP